MTEKQKELYNFYTHIAEKAFEELQIVKQKMMEPGIDVDEYDRLIVERERLDRRIRYSSRKREEVRLAKTQYERLLKQAAELKEEYGL